METTTIAQFDNRVRLAVYEHFVKNGQSPAVAQVASAVACPIAEAKAAFQRLADAHVLVLQPVSGEILMANPLSAVPTAFEVQTPRGKYFANCIWDGLGVIAMLDGSGTVHTACGCCSEAMQVEIRGGNLVPASGIMHFAIPAARWWDDIVFN